MLYGRTNEECERQFAAEQIIIKHGYVPLGFLPGVTLEDLEEFAAKLEKENE